MRHLLISLELRLEVRWEQVRHAADVQVPDLQRVEPEASLGLAAEVDLKFVVFLVSGAITKETNVVEIAEVAVLLRLLHSRRKLLGGISISHSG